MGKRPTERSAACTTCGKTFARSDTLLRHEKSHIATEDRGPIHRVTNGTFRACSGCAHARSRCSGGLPCGRCKTRNLECIYPSKRRRGSTHGEGEVQKSPSSQFPQFVFASTSNPSGAGSSQRRPEPVQMSLPIPPSIPLDRPGVQQMPTMEANMPDMTSGSHGLPNLDRYAEPSAPIQYQTPFDSQQQQYGEPNLYDIPLNLNWLPLSVYPSPYGDIDQEFSFLLPSVSDAASINTNLHSLNLEASLALPSETCDEDVARSASLNYQPSASISGLMQSPTSTGSDSAMQVDLSVNAIGAREPRKKRRKTANLSASFPHSQASQAGFSFPDMSPLSRSSKRSWCSEEQYSSVITTFQKLCIESSRWTPFLTSAFPDRVAFTSCIDLYFEHLHLTFPLIHAPTFESDASWLTCLATASLGSTFATFPQSADAREAFQEFLRRAVLDATDRYDGDFRNIHLAQARILCLVGLTQSDHEQLRSRAPRSHADIARWCLESSILQLTDLDERLQSYEDVETQWHGWIQRESLHRVGYFIWYLDCALGYICNARPLCNMDDARAPLPCPEVLWESSSAQQWLARRNNMSPMPSLCAALETMYNEKKIVSDWSETSYILLIHALYSRTWEVGTHIKQPLSEWKATGDARGFLNTPSKDDLWLPLYPLYANWRNSACDCLDVLHWHANEVTARNAGAEHHAVLHLHLARIILLTPFQEIQDLLFFLINHRVSDLSKASFYVHDGSYQPRNPAKLAQIRRITWRWLREDQHKARLAMIHAGSVFWYVRRYSTRSFFEPLAIYLASIVLWTYGSFKSNALARDAVAEQDSNRNDQPPTTATRAQDSQSSGRAGEVQAAPGENNSVQPTRVERGARDHTDFKTRSSIFASRTETSATPSLSFQNSGPIVPVSSSTTITTSTATQAAHPSYQHRSRLSSDQDSIPVSNGVPDGLSNTASNISNNSDDEDEDDDNDDDHPTFIHLDRPCDDEIVQHFVRAGAGMSGFMTGVGDLCQTPDKVLTEGAKILRTRLSCWGVSREYHDILTRLAERKSK